MRIGWWGLIFWKASLIAYQLHLISFCNWSAEIVWIELEVPLFFWIRIWRYDFGKNIWEVLRRFLETNFRMVISWSCGVENEVLDMWDVVFGGDWIEKWEKAFETSWVCWVSFWYYALTWALIALEFIRILVWTLSSGDGNLELCLCAESVRFECLCDLCALV